MNKYFDAYDSAYDNYYFSQAGHGYNKDYITYFSGKPFQRGYSIFSTIGKLSLPILKFFGKKAFNYGKDVAQDVISGENLKSSLKTNLKKMANDTIDDVGKMINQKGKRRRVRRVSKRKLKRKGKSRKQHKKVKHRKRTVRARRKSKKRIKRTRKNIFDSI